MPVTYPVEFESDVVLRDGSTLRLRPVRPEDEGALLQFFESLSPESLYFRFMAVPRIDVHRVRALSNVDYENEFALVGESQRGIVALAGFYRAAPGAERAEVAFAIADHFQGRGIGTRMLERLADIARARGVRTFNAYVLGENRRMMEVFLDSGYAVQRHVDGGVYHVVLSLEQTAEYEQRAAERSQSAAVASMKAFFEPRGVAVVGANRARGKIGAEVLHNLKTCGFTGGIYPVNPYASDIEGLRSYPSVASVPAPVDLAVVCLPAAEVLDAVDDCIDKGVRGIVVISAGFGEAGAAGKERQTRLLEKIRAAGIRMIGPNCMGILNTDPAVNLNATFAQVSPPPGRVAMSTQSGALGVAILDAARRLNIGISSFVSIGNKPDVSGNDLLQYWDDDPRTDVILLYLESFGNPKKFSQIARRISQRKPIVAVKAGRSRAGERAASSHTGALATSDAVVDALCRQAGVIRTTTLDEMFDVAALLANQPLPRGRRVAILSNAGGPGILAADACEANGLELPVLDEKTKAALRLFLPEAASVGNPVDMLASAPAEHFKRALDLLLADPNVDAAMAIFIPPLVTEGEAVARAIVSAARESTKPVLATFMEIDGAPTVLTPVPCYPFPESAAIALARVAAFAEWRARDAGSVPTFADIDRNAVRAVATRALARGGGWLTPPEVSALLTAAGLTPAVSRVVTTKEAALAAAAEIGFPVVMKAISASIVHKSDAGAVRLGVASAEEASEVYGEFAAKFGVDLAGVLVQEMVTGGVEMFVGALHDPSFGPVLACGSGGVLVDLLRDSVFRLHPLSDADATDMLQEVRGAKLLRGYRGAPPVDEPALRDALLRVSALLEICPEIQELDINPVKVLSAGARILDARIRIEKRPGQVSRRIVY
ncbi:MAG TPA: GNAT family N-acetyltransferase [Vicinamibacterales bacterium]|nr:GNAT family N-acetyltransferase [Vicinamibacterales bacterium]